MDYMYIRAWHKLTGSLDYYIEEIVERAKEDGAPEDSIYYSDLKNRWATVRDLAEGHSMIPEMNAWVNAQIGADYESK